MPNNKSIGLNVQETILGTYKLNGTEKIVVACKDFTKPGTVLKQFAELKNSQIETSKNGYGTDLFDVNKGYFDQVKNKSDYTKNAIRTLCGVKAHLKYMKIENLKK